MASKKKTPAQIQLEKERREFVQARPNLEKPEARTRFYVQKRAAELEAAGKPVDRKALRQKYKSGGVQRAGFYTEGDLKRIAAQKAAANKGGTSGKGSNTTGQTQTPRLTTGQMQSVRRQSVQGWGQTPAAPAKVWKPDAIQRTLDSATNPSNWLKWAKAGGSKALNFASREGESIQATFINPLWNQTGGRINPKLKQREANPVEAIVNTASVVASILGTPAAGSAVKGLAAGGKSAVTSSITKLTSRSASKIDDVVKIKPGELGGVRFTAPKPTSAATSAAKNTAKSTTKKTTTVITPTPVTRASTAGGIRGAAQGAKGAAAGAKGAAKGAKGAAGGAKLPKVAMSGRRGAAAVATTAKKTSKKAATKTAKVDAKPAAQVIEKTVTKATPAPVKAAAKKVAKKATAKKAVAKKAAAVKKEAAPKFEGMIYTGPRMSGTFLETTAKSSGSNLEMVSSDVINAMVQNQSKAMAQFVAEGGEEVVETVAKKAAAPRVVAKNVAKKGSAKTSKSTAKKAYDVKIGGQPKNIRTVEEATFKTTKELDKWISGGGKELLRNSDEVTRAAFEKRNAKIIKELRSTVSSQKKSSAGAVMKNAKTMARYRRARPETQALYNRIVFARANRQG
jgi:hypothetical protein